MCSIGFGQQCPEISASYQLEMVIAAKAVADTTRMRILNLLLHKECCVCEVMYAINISQPRASRSLKTLHDAGFLNMREQGPYTIYTLKVSRKPRVHSSIIDGVKLQAAKNPVFDIDLERLKSAPRYNCNTIVKGRFKKLPDSAPGESTLQNCCC
jgi:ArsR family transcriptional regulator